MIHDVALFVTDIGFAAMARQSGSTVARTVPNKLIPSADAGLGLNGALVSYCAGRSLEIENVAKMSDQEWSRLLDARFSGRPWRRWFGKTPSAIYSVAVAEG